jgi:hypothetical protein
VLSTVEYICFRGLQNNLKVFKVMSVYGVQTACTIDASSAGFHIPCNSIAGSWDHVLYIFSALRQYCLLLNESRAARCEYPSKNAEFC